MRSASGTGWAPATHPNISEIKPEGRAGRRGREVRSAAAFWDRGWEARGPHLGDRVAELLGVGYVVAPNADDFRTRREEPLRRRSRHGRQGWCLGGQEVSRREQR